MVRALDSGEEKVQADEARCGMHVTMFHSGSQIKGHVSNGPTHTQRVCSGVQTAVY